jgi:hypothetical protein
MKAMRIGLLLAAVAVIGLLPSAALAQRVVPPGNSGINQYQETLPGPGGNELPAKKQRSPKQVLGARNAQRLEHLGPAGRAAAALAAATTPERSGVHDRGVGGGGVGSGGGGGRTVSADQPSGSSGLGEVLGQATGSTSSGKMGLFLPLAIVATLFGAIAYAARRRRTARGS